MSKKTHEKQLARARAKREAERAVARSNRNRVIVIVMVVLLIGTLAFALTGGDDTPEVIDDPTSLPTDPSALPSGSFAAACDPAVGPTSTATPYTEPPTTEVNPDVVYEVAIATTCGEIVVLLDPQVAPATVENFLALARDGYYDGSPFHRVMEGFMIQGGDPTGTGHGNGGTFPGYTIDDELAQAEALVAEFGGYPRGALATANAGPNTVGSQFFIVQGQVPTFAPAGLAPQYTVFGWTVEGLDIVDRIAVGPYRLDNRELAANPVVITGITITEVERPAEGIYPTAGQASPSPSPAATATG